MDEQTPNKRPGRKTNPRWEALPIGTRLTLSEAARILNIGRETLRINYCGNAAPRRRPDGVEIIRDAKTVLIVRTR